MRSIVNPVYRVAICIAVVTANVAVLYALPLSDRPLTATLIFLFVVLIVSSVWRFRYAVFVSLLAALGFAWSIPPPSSFKFSDSRDLFVLAAFLVIGIITSHLADRARREALNANRRRAEALAAQRRFADLVNSVEERWRAAFESNPTMYFIMDAAEKVVSVNAFGAEQLGYGANQFIGHGMLATIGDHKRAEQALRRSEAYLSEAQSLTHTGIWAYNPAAGKTTHGSEEMFQIYGINPQRGMPQMVKSLLKSSTQRTTTDIANCSSRHAARRLTLRRITRSCCLIER